jgi:hypothetical protein
LLFTGILDKVHEQLTFPSGFPLATALHLVLGTKESTQFSSKLVAKYVFSFTDLLCIVKADSHEVFPYYR